eukprot:9498468-Pyramimonas_sp.AAC.1
MGSEENRASKKPNKEMNISPPPRCLTDATWPHRRVPRDHAILLDANSLVGKCEGSKNSISSGVSFMGPTRYSDTAGAPRMRSSRSSRMRPITDAE